MNENQTDTSKNAQDCGSAVERLVRPIRYAVEQRLRFIDFLAHHYGHVNRKALEDFFGISKPQATKDFKAYVKLAPDNIRYNSSDKAYLRNPEFKRVWA